MGKFLQVPPKSATDEVWTMKDGRKIAVCDMSESHAKNALRLVLRRARELKASNKNTQMKSLYEAFIESLVDK